ncbi:MAG TPA: RdgB/HAM1 family non-canonical purine NTP pyrophosphatase [Opitutaceae bacterium]|jgi:XTP/dITP diphosphohydrolase|nr:RdgB/HAM1 family non-canonical purine NTP pyrophosphatase [Opitutaceae bacterium]
MKLFLASGNAHKAEEFSAFAKASAAAEAAPIEIISATAVGGMPAVEEDAGTFAGNARKKALALRAQLPADAWVLADDSGLCVDALGGAPGVESAYYAGPHGDSAANLKKLIETMRGVPDPQRGAYFICVLVLAGPAGEFVFEGRCDGRLLAEPRGGSGFGYDPLFVPEGHGQSFSELGAKIKNGLSHRARAWEKLAEWLRKK